MRRSLSEYVPLSLHWWWLLLVGVLATIIGGGLDVGSSTGWTLVTVPYWVGRTTWISGLIITLLIAPFLAFHKVRVERDEALAALNVAALSTGSRSDPVATAPTLYLQNWDNRYEFGHPGDEGYPKLNDSRILRLYVYFEPTHAMHVEQVEIDVSGKAIPALWNSEYVSNGYAPYVYFGIPASIGEGRHEVQVVAFGAGKWWKSPSYTIIFPKP